jgi:protease I
MTPVADMRSKHVAIIVPSRYFNEMDYYGIQQALVKEGIYPVIASTVLADIKGIQRGGVQRNIITSTILVRDLKIQDYDAFVFVSGSGIGGDYLYNRDILNLVRSAHSAGKILAAITDAPAFFANAGIVRNKNITSSVSQRNKINQAGAIWQRNPLVIDGNLITAGDSAENSSDAGNARVSDRFATAVVSMLKGRKIAY